MATAARCTEEAAVSQLPLCVLHPILYGPEGMYVASTNSISNKAEWQAQLSTAQPAQHSTAQHSTAQHSTAQHKSAQRRGLLLLQLLDSGLGVTVEMVAKDGQSNQLKRACLILHLLLTHACKV